MALLLLAVLILILPAFLGFKVFIVRGSSMEPYVQAGSLAYVRTASPEEISPEDVITFNALGNLTTTHRVLDINYQEGFFITKGDANKLADPAVPFDNLIGKLSYSIPYVGFVTAIIKSRAGFVSITLTALILLFASFAPMIPRGKNKGENL